MAGNTDQGVGCDCPLAGYCERHQMFKHKHWHALCQSDAGYRSMWDARTGPGQQTIGDPIEMERRRKRAGRSKGVGDTVYKVARRLGFRHCAGCSRRRAWLNRVLPYPKSR